MNNLLQRLRAKAFPTKSAPDKTGRLPATPGVGVSRQGNIVDWLNATMGPLDYAGPVEWAALDQFFNQLACADLRIGAGKEIVHYFTRHPEKARLLCGSEYFLALRGESSAVRLAYVAANYVLGQSNRCLRVAEELAASWPAAFTAVILARVRRECFGPEREIETLAAALDKWPDDALLRLNFVGALVAADRVADANAVVAGLRPLIEKELGDEIATVVRSQEQLDRAIETGAFAPEGGDDIYSDESCRNYWLSYNESFVTRRDRQHGDRLLLNRFLAWVRSVEQDVDVVLDFGSLCAQPLYEAALAAPHIRFVGTDRQELIAEMNRVAYPLPNLSFDHGDIFDVMARVASLPGRKALAHIRTTCTLYPKFVEELYRAAADLRFEHIYLIENAGFVRSRLEFVCFETMQELALATKHRLNLHNYREQLSRSGYEVHRFGRLTAPGLWRGEHPANYLGSQYEIHAVRSPAG